MDKPLTCFLSVYPLSIGVRLESPFAAQIFFTDKLKQQEAGGIEPVSRIRKALVQEVLF